MARGVTRGLSWKLATPREGIMQHEHDPYMTNRERAKFVTLTDAFRADEQEHGSYRGLFASTAWGIVGGALGEESLTQGRWEVLVRHADRAVDQPAEPTADHGGCYYDGPQ